MDQKTAPSMPIPGMAGSLEKCGTCKLGVSVGLAKPLECHLNPPHVAIFLVPGPNNQPVTLNATKYPDVNRDDAGCQYHQPKLVS